MSLFSWLSGSPRDVPSTAPEPKKRPKPARNAAPLWEHSVSPDITPADGPKSLRHARREQLYAAIREAMTAAGVLTARFKFKVLSLDKQGDNFMVMMNLSGELGARDESLSAMEQQIMRQAFNRYQITVSAVYWRLEESSANLQPPRKSVSRVEAVATPELTQSHATPPASASAPGRYRPIEFDELAAFKEARVAAAARGPAPAEPLKSKNHSAPPSRHADFADTQLADSSDQPGLSATQYGDL